MTGLASKFRLAHTFHQQGDFARAQSIYQEIIEIEPNHFETLNLLGVIAGQTRNLQQAVQWFDKAIELKPRQAAPYCNRGLALQELGQWEAALASYDQAIAIKADYAIAFYNRGIVLKELEQWDAALASYDRAIALNPGFSLAYHNRALLLKELKQWDAALACFDHAIRIKADYYEAHYNRGVLLQELEQWDAARGSYDNAIGIKRDYAEAYLNRGVVLAKLRQFEAALRSYDDAIAIRASYASAYSNRAYVLIKLQQWDAALDSCNKAISIAPGLAEPYLSRGSVLGELEQWEAALVTYERAIGVEPRNATAHSNRGVVLVNLNRFDEALASYDQAIAIETDYAEARSNRAQLLLQRGDFRNGWLEYEWRWRLADTPLSAQADSFSKPRWTGEESIAGQTILVHAEQGFGDTLLFCRYVSLVAELGARVIFAVQTPLASLLADLTGVSHLITQGSVPPDFDCHCPLMSLPLAFKTTLSTIPAPGKYLCSEAAKVARFQERLGAKNAPRIGLAWSGSAINTKDRSRSVRLAEMMGILPGGFQYVSLQKEVREVDEPTLRARPDILNFANELQDFSDTAALCECLDVVICVDTGVAHLSGGLGRRTWVLLARNADWRWFLDRDDSPWYPGAKLYRQDTLGDWSAVLERVKADLLRELKSD